MGGLLYGAPPVPRSPDMRARALAALILSVAAAGVAPAADTTHRYTVLFQGKPGGSQVTVLHADGSMSVDFTYRTNGRGPDVKEEIAFDKGGAQLRHQLTGKSTFGGPIDELYERRGATARWRSVADSGEAPVAGAAAYVPIAESSMETYALLARAASRQPGRAIAALPGGRVGVEKLRTLVLRDGARRREIALYAIGGLDFEPVYVWLTSAPELRFFAYAYPGWMQVVEDGWEGQIGAIESAQIEAQARQLGALVPKLAHRVPEPILLRNARVFDSEHARLGPTSDVYVNRGRIAAVYPAGSTPRDAATVVDAAGRVLMPALFDMHDHAAPWAGVLQMAGGVTTTRDMANDNAVLAADMARVEAGGAIGPRIVPAGFIEGQSEHAARAGFVVNDI